MYSINKEIFMVSIFKKSLEIAENSWYLRNHFVKIDFTIHKAKKLKYKININILYNNVF